MNKQEYNGEFSCWGDDGKESWGTTSVMGQFHEPLDTPEPEYVWAKYNHECYDGAALIVYKQGDFWYSVYASHCSCYGLEDQWTPEPFDPAMQFEALRKGKTLFGYYSNEFDSVNEWLKEMVAQSTVTLSRI